MEKSRSISAAPTVPSSLFRLPYPPPLLSSRPSSQTSPIFPPINSASFTKAASSRTIKP
uniref:Uncharacterized protein MANES_01G154200 n=1 Tax=Rhizophora mucronata TaxID=61149 RepID=A0A2P2K3U6_RHIMU